MKPFDRFPENEYEEEVSKVDLLLIQASYFFMRQILLENPSWDKEEFSAQYKESCLVCLRKQVRKNLVTKEYIYTYCDKSFDLCFQEYSTYVRKSVAGFQENRTES